MKKSKSKPKPKPRAPRKRWHSVRVRSAAEEFNTSVMATNTTDALIQAAQASTIMDALLIIPERHPPLLRHPARARHP